MPRPRCSVCLHPELHAIDDALRRGVPSLRDLAKKVDVTSASLFRHKRHAIDDRPVKGHVISNIRSEIGKLRQAQTAARKRRDIDTALSISREIRNWLALEAKTQSVSRTETDTDALLSGPDALALAKSVIESQLADPALLEWLDGLQDRLRATGRLPETHD
jgi:hypothetical protein